MLPNGEEEKKSAYISDKNPLFGRGGAARGKSGTSPPPAVCEGWILCRRMRANGSESKGGKKLNTLSIQQFGLVCLVLF